MKRLASQLVIFIVTLCITHFAIAQKREYPRLDDKRYPIYVKAIILDKNQQPIDVTIWLQSLATSDKIALERISEGVYEAFVENEQEQDFIMLGSKGTVQFNSGTMRFPAMTKRKQKVEKTLALTMAKEEIKEITEEKKELARSVQQAVILEIEVVDENEKPLNAIVSMYDDAINLKIEDLKQRKKGVFTTQFRQDFDKSYLFKVVYQDSVYHRFMLTVPAATNEKQSLNRKLVCTLQKQDILANNSNIADTAGGKKSIEIKSIGTQQKSKEKPAEIPKKEKERESIFELPSTNGKITVWKVQFENKYTDKIAASAYPTLEELYFLFKQHNQTSFEISLHTDNLNGQEQSLEITQKQAEALYDYFVSKGISGKQISIKSYGATQPIASNDDEKDGRELNRRLEVRIR